MRILLTSPHHSSSICFTLISNQFLPNYSSQLKNSTSFVSLLSHWCSRHIAFHKRASLQQCISLSGQIPHHVAVSAEHGWCLDDLLEAIWDYLSMLRIYTKPKGQIPDYSEPGLFCFAPASSTICATPLPITRVSFRRTCFVVILHAEHPTVEQFCQRIHRCIMSQVSAISHL